MIEGESPRAVALAAAGDAISDDSDSSLSEEETENATRGSTYRVSSGKVKLLEGGMGQFVGLVERRLERARREQDKVSSGG